jgi:hypothetical protein
MLTWSSCPADDGIESTDAGCASVLHSLTSDAAVYCTSMKPEFSPLAFTRNGGSPLDFFGSVQAVQPAFADRGERHGSGREGVERDRATGMPWKLPPARTSPASGSTIGLSLTALASIDRTPAA